MKWILLISMLFIGCLELAQAQNASVTSRQVLLKGTIDKYPATLRLYQVKNAFHGYCYYDKFEKPLEVSGSITKGGKLKLEEYNVYDGNTETFDGLMDENGYGGTWTAHGKNLIFRFTPAKDNVLPFDYIYTYGERKLKKKEDVYRDQVSYDAASVWPAANASHPAVPFVKQLIRKEFDEKASQGDIGPIMLKLKKQALDTSKMSEDGIEYETDERLQVLYFNNRLLVLSHYTYVDGGGAHGNYFTSFVCVDLVGQSVLNLNDVLDSAGAHKQLQKLLEEQLKNDRHMKKEDSLSGILFEDTMSLTNNIFLTGKGIGFCYNPYQIASYADGEIDIFIPYKRLEPFLRPKFKKLIEENNNK
jgi:hypothetical protein